MLNVQKKIEDMQQLSAYRKQLLQKPQLRNLFLELTLQCNENCLHCGSRCSAERSTELTFRQYQAFLEKIRQDFGTEELLLCITGGEPLLRKDFFEIMSYANQLGFAWGMTSNATLIDTAVAKKLKACGMRTISVSIDGLPQTHDRIRCTKGGYERAMRGIAALLEVGGFSHIQVTTVVNHENFHELEALYQIFDKMDIDSWRVINMEPIGRAKEHPELLLTPEEYRGLAEFIRKLRIAGEPVTFGCSHYLGMEYERELRDWYFLCTAGLYTASIMANGDITACLDMERRPELIQGNILTEDFTEIWKHGFSVFRRDLCEESEKCRNCKEKDFCRGDSFHTWNFDKQKPEICLREILY